MAKTAPRPKAADLVENIDDDVWVADEAAGPSLVSRLSAEFFGTFCFMLIGLGVGLFAALQTLSTRLTNASDIGTYLSFLASDNGSLPLASALAWGLALIGLIAAVQRVSGAHFNPAVTLGLWVAGRTPGRDVAPYIVSQLAGAIGAAALVRWFASGLPVFDSASELITTSGAQAPTLGQAMSVISIGSDEHSPTGAALTHGVAIEFIATALLVAVILAVTSKRAPRGQAPVAIGLAISVLIMFAAPFTGAGLNPARITSTALFATNADGAFWAIGHLWIWWLTGLLAAGFIGLLFRGFGPLEDLENEPAVDADKA